MPHPDDLRPSRKYTPEEDAEVERRWGLDKPPWTTAARGPRGYTDREKHYYDDNHRRDLVDDANAMDEAEERAMREEDGHLRTEQRQGLVGQGARTDFPNNANLWGYGYVDASHGFPPQPYHPHGYKLNEDDIAAYHDGYAEGKEPKRRLASTDGSYTDGKIIGACPGCSEPIRKHQTAHGDEIRHLHNNHVRCFGRTAGLPGLGGGDGAAGLAADTPAGAAIKGAEIGGDLLHGAENSLEKAPDEWSYRAESALQFYADYLGRPDAFNPTGKGPDEYKARTWNAYETTRPMQSVDDRGVNTPVLPAEPIKTRQINTPTPGLEGRDNDIRDRQDDDEDDDED